mgnify:CR=1 FL=1
MKKTLLMAVAALSAYLLFWPVAIEPVAWQSTPSQGYTGVYAPNSQLASVERLPINGSQTQLHGPEAVAVGPDNQLYFSTGEGWIVRHDPVSGRSARWVNVGGRPLGLAFSQQGDLVVANAYLGLQAVDRSGAVRLLTDHIGGRPIEYADDLDIGTDGTIYFSDASSKFAAQRFGGTYPASILDLLEHGGHGQLLAYSPATGATSLLLDGLQFANGVAVSSDGRFVLVNETGANRIVRYWLRGEQRGQSEIFLSGLPGFPDNIVRHGEHFWVGLVSPRLPVLDKLAGWPLLRKVVARLPEQFKPAAKHYGHLIKIDRDGRVIESLQDPKGGYHTITGAQQISANGRDWLYLTSLHERSLARLAYPIE